MINYKKLKLAQIYFIPFCILNHCSINGNTTFIISLGIEIGDNSFISCDCEIIDEDFHKLF